MHTDLFRESFSTGAKYGKIEGDCIDLVFYKGCVDVGGEIDVELDGMVAMTMTLEGFGGGTVTVDYPVTVTFTAPEDNSFDPGETVTIGTSLTVDGSRANVAVDFPTFDGFALDTEFAIDASADARFCFVSCTRRDLLSGSTAHEPLRLLELDDGVLDYTYGCLSLEVQMLLKLSTFGHDRCNERAYASHPEPDFTTTVTDTSGLRATAADLFFVFPFSGVDWLANHTMPWWAVPNLPPVEAKGVEIGWRSFDAIITALTTLHQEIDFDPTVEITLAWDGELDYEVVDPATDIQVDSGTGSSATLHVGQELRITTDDRINRILDLTPRARLVDAVVDDRTWIQSGGNFEMMALAFTLKTPRWQVCDDVLGCTPRFRVNADFGPVWRQSLSLGGQPPVEIHDGSYPVTGFQEFDLEPFSIVPRPRVQIRSEVRPVNAPGTFDLLLDDDVVAHDVADGGTSGMIVLAPETYSISVENGENGDLAYYDVHIDCVHRADDDVHTERVQVRTATENAADATFDIALTGGEDLICTVLIRLPVPWECDSMTFANVVLGDPHSDASEILRGTTGNDIIVGYGGDDLILGIAGDDCTAGGDGNDRIVLGPGRSVADTGPGNNHVVAGSGDLVHVGSGNNRISGNGATAL